MKLRPAAKYITFLLLIITTSVLSTPPHIIFMLVDDLGWNDVSFHGSIQIPTANIDTLAYSGVILNNYYVQPICTPSRGSLMTGKYPIRLGLQHYVISAAAPWGLSPEEVILPEYLKQLGYATHAVGKWHLGYFRKDYLPTKRGFDSFFGYYNGKNDYFTHFQANKGMAGLDFHLNEENVWNYTGYYATEAFTDRAKKIIKDHDSSKPLFLYLAHQAVHAGNSYSPLQAPKEYREKFSHIKDEKRRGLAAMALALDKSIGEIFSALDEEGMLKNSVLIFSTDNGGAVKGIDQSSGSNWPLRGSKYNMWEGGVRGTAFMWSPLLPIQNGSISNHLMHVSDWLPTLYAIAGGDPKELGKIDGYNIWPTLTKNATSPRDRILHNVDTKWRVKAIRKGQYKLLKGSVFGGNFDGWFDKEGNKEENVKFEENELSVLEEVYKTFLENSEVFQILTQKSNDYLPLHLRPKTEHQEIVCLNSNNENKEDENNVNLIGHRLYPHPFSAPVVIDCGIKPENASTNCQPMDKYCLFDVENDPCEFNNLANTLPTVVKELKRLLKQYKEEAVPVRNKPSDPKASPRFHGYAWVPWIDANSDEQQEIEQIKQKYEQCNGN